MPDSGSVKRIGRCDTSPTFPGSHHIAMGPCYRWAGEGGCMLVPMHIDFKSRIFFVQRVTSPPAVSPFPQMRAQAVGF